MALSICSSTSHATQCVGDEEAHQQRMLPMPHCYSDTGSATNIPFPLNNVRWKMNCNVWPRVLFYPTSALSLSLSTPHPFSRQQIESTTVHGDILDHLACTEVKGISPKWARPFKYYFWTTVGRYHYYYFFKIGIPVKHESQGHLCLFMMCSCSMILNLDNREVQNMACGQAHLI